jgi:hypothetical protein
MSGHEAGRRSAMHVSQALPATIEYETAGCVFAIWKNVVIAIWATQATSELVAELSRIATYWADQREGQFSTVHVIRNGSPLPNGEARAALMALIEQFGHRLACVATQIEGAGFWASAMRSLLTSLRLIGGRTSYKARTFQTTQEIATWLAEAHVQGTGIGLDADEFKAVLAGLMARPSIAETRD